MSASGRPEALRTDALGVVAYGHEAVGDRLHESGRPAHVGEAVGAGERHFAQHLLVYSPGVALPPGRLDTRKREDGLVRLELGAIDDVVARARRVEEACGNLGGRRTAMAE